MNVLALNGSPKKDGNISVILSELCKGFLDNGHKIEKIFLDNLNIKDCKGCMECQTIGQCTLRDDDISKIEAAFRQADIIIFATPVHWGNMSAIMLRTIERLFGFLIQERIHGFPVARNGKGKRTILVTACSTLWPFNFIFNQSRAVFGRFKEICKYSKIKIIKKYVLTGTNKKAKATKKDLKTVYDIGHNIKDKKVRTGPLSHF